MSERRAVPETGHQAPAGRTRVGAYAVCVDGEERILLCRLSLVESLAGAWTLPGGGLEFGEHPDEAVVRELREESGLVGEIEDLAGVFSHVYRRSRAAGGADLHFIGILYRMRITGGVLRDEVDGTTDTCAWLSRAELAGLRLVEIARHGVALAFAEGRPDEPR